MSEAPDYRGPENVPVLQVVAAAWQFLLRNLVSQYVYGAPFIVASGAMAWVGAYVPIDNPAYGLSLPLFAFSIMFFWIMSAAQYRLALGLPEKGLAGLDFGLDELRLFVTVILVSLVAYIVASVVAIFVWLGISGIMVAGVDPETLPKDPNAVLSYFIEHGGTRFYASMAIGAFMVWAVLLYLLSRFVPAFPASIAEKRVIVFEASNWTKGEGVRIALASVIVVLPLYVLMLPDIVGGLHSLMDTMTTASGKTPQEMSAISQAASRERFGWEILTIMLVPALNAVRAGLYVTLYRGLRPQET